MPLEILLEIFGHLIYDPGDEQRPSNYFPNEGLKVSRLWRDLIVGKKKLWSRIVYFVGWTTIADLKAFLSYSGTQQDLHFAIIRSPPYSQLIGSEKEEAQTALDILKPFFRRLYSVRIHLKANTSLPSIRSLYNIPRELFMIRLSSSHNHIGYPQEPDRGRKSYLRTRALSVNGRAFSEISQDTTNSVLGPIYNLQRLSVTAIPKEFALNIGETLRFFRSCPYLRSVRLADVALDKRHAPSIAQTPVNIQNLDLERIELTSLCQLLDNIVFPPSAELLRLAYCKYTTVQSSTPTMRFPLFSNLVLEGFGKSSPKYILSGLEAWCGFELTLVDCPIFAQTVVEQKEESLTSGRVCLRNLTILKVLRSGEVDLGRVKELMIAGIQVVIDQ